MARATRPESSSGLSTLLHHTPWGLRDTQVPALRAALVTEIVTTLGVSLAEVARQFGVTTSALSRAVRRPGGE